MYEDEKTDGKAEGRKDLILLAIGVSGIQAVS
jgi:hypothetical protein